MFVSCGSELRIEELGRFARLPEEELSISMAGLIANSRVVFSSGVCGGGNVCVYAVQSRSNGWRCEGLDP